MKISRNSWHYRYRNWVDKNMLGFSTIEETESAFSYVLGLTIVIGAAWVFVPVIFLGRLVGHLEKEKLELTD